MNSEFIIKLMADWVVFPIVIIGSLLLIIKVPNDKKFQSYCRILMSGLTAYLLAKIIGSVYQPSAVRPFELLGTSAGASFLNNPGFPSDHALFITAITCAVWFETKQKIVSFILALLVIIVCIGRVLALVHTPADVIGGVIIAIIGSIWYLDKK